MRNRPAGEGNVRDPWARSIALDVFRVVGGEQNRVAEGEPKPLGPGGDLFRVAENGQPGHPSVHDPGGGVEDPVVVALREDDVRARGPSPGHQLLFEHQWCHGTGGGRAESIEEEAGIDIGGKDPRGRVNLAQ